MSVLGTLFSKIPWGLVFIGFIFLQGYGLMVFFTDEGSSPYLEKVKQLEQENARIVDLERKKREAEAFMQQLEAKRAELRAAAVELTKMRVSLGEELDIASFVKMLVTEAKRVNIRVQSIEPGREDDNKDGKNLVVGQPFTFKFKGVFAQVIVFLERLLQSTRIVSVEGYDFSPIQATVGRYAELDGSLTIKTYRYDRTKADEVAARSVGTP